MEIQASHISNSWKHFFHGIIGDNNGTSEPKFPRGGGVRYKRIFCFIDTKSVKHIPAHRLLHLAAILLYLP